MMKKQLLVYLCLFTLSVNSVTQKPKEVEFSTYFKKTLPWVTLFSLGWNVYAVRTFPHIHTIPKAVSSLASVPVAGALCVSAILCSKNNKNFMQAACISDVRRRDIKRNSFVLDNV